MATIKINEIRFIGSDLLTDSESYLDELSDTDTSEITGGVATPIIIGTAAVFIASLQFSFQVSRNYTR